ncbi:MAG: hypothetical protein O2980_03735 [Actinomycetota bacterium]|nr:hypothetical protein [Actinomycetota bacterium]
MPVGFADRLRAWLRGEDAPAHEAQPQRPSRSDRGGGDAASLPRRVGRRRGRAQHPSGSFDGSVLLEFARSRNGVEIYLEPRTRLYGDSVLLVADDGEYLRRPVPDPDTVRRFCSQHGIPVYDAERTGYPRRVRDYDRGVRPDRIGLEDLPPWPGKEQDLAPPDVTAEEEPPPPPPSA